MIVEAEACPAVSILTPRFHRDCLPYGHLHSTGICQHRRKIQGFDYKLPLAALFGGMFLRGDDEHGLEAPIPHRSQIPLSITGSIPFIPVYTHCA